MTNTVHWLHPDELDAWDAFVNRHPLGTVVQRSCWKRVLEKSFRHIRGHVLTMRDPRTKRISAGIPVYTVRSKLLGNRMVSVPFGTLCDPLFTSPQECRPLMEALLQARKVFNCSRVEVRTFRTSDTVRPLTLQRDSHFKHHYLVLDRSLPDVRRTFHTTAVKQMLRKAERHELVMKRGENETDLRRFYGLFLRTRRTLGLPPIPFRFFHHLHNELAPSGHASLFLAQYEGKVIGAAVTLQFNDVVALEFMGDISAYRRLGVIQFLYWCAIQDAHEHGYRLFSFGRTSTSNTGLLTFKRRWGTLEADLPVSLFPPPPTGKIKPIERSWKYRLVSNACRHVPSPVYRLLGDFCYRHMG